MEELFPGVFKFNYTILTRNLVKGKKVYGEKLFQLNSHEYREWIPFRSKIGAAIRKGIKFFPVKKNTKILYLGVAEGTTASHLSDIIGINGFLAGIDLSKRTVKKFISLCEERKNMIPLLADASHPETYEKELNSLKFDVLVQDISQKNQAEIFLKNAKVFLKKKGYGLISIKARSISSFLPAKKIFEKEKKQLKSAFKIIECITLEPYEKEHLFCVLQKK